jgi:serine/threonine protein kinase
LGNVTKEDVDNEIRALKKLCQNGHPNIVQVFEYGQLNPDGAVYFIDMELCDVSLEKYLQGAEIDDAISWETVRKQDEIPSHAYNILQQILNGLIYIHCLGEVHRDISPANGTFPSPALLIVSSVQERGLEDCGFRTDIGSDVKSFGQYQRRPRQTVLSISGIAPGC